MSSIVCIENSNLSLAWAEAFLALMQPGCTEITPLAVTVRISDGGNIDEHEGIRQLIDNALADHKSSCNTVANTIFPKSLWNPKRDRTLLYERYLKYAWPRVRKCQANYRGTYFHRLVAFDNGNDEPVNQLEHVIRTWQKGNHRHSALQLSVFDPRRDHTDCRQMGFPCLHQVCFTPLGTNGRAGLAVTGFYATQHILEKAYGNYLGLSRLGHFVAHETNLRLVRMTCIAASGRLGNVEKKDLRPFAAQLGRLVGETKKD
jgi:thymidylate synthase